MKGELITYQVAKIAVEKGFEGIKSYCVNDGDVSGYSNLPYQAELQRWLRELHGIDVFPYLLEGKDFPYCSMLFENKIEKDYFHSFQTYEAALEFGLLKGLELIPAKPVHTKIEDLKVIDKKNKVIDHKRYNAKVEPFNVYPVMYVDGQPIWEGDQVLFFDDKGKVAVREMFWANRHQVAMMGGDKWVKQFFLTINKAFKLPNNG